MKPSNTPSKRSWAKWMKAIEAAQKKQRSKSVIRWMYRMKDSGAFLCIVYEEKELKRLRCVDRCSGERDTRLVKVRITEVK